MIRKIEAIPSGPSAYEVTNPIGLLRKFKPGDLLVFRPFNKFKTDRPDDYPRKGTLVLVEVVLEDRITVQVWAVAGRGRGGALKMKPGANDTNGLLYKRIIGVLLPTATSLLSEARAMCR